MGENRLFKQLMLSVVIFVFLAGMAHAAGNKLVISDVDVKVGSRTSNNLHNGDTIREEAKPGDNIEVRVEVENNFTNAENLRINDIVITVNIEEIDDGDDLEEESNEFDLSTQSTKRSTLKFQVPVEVEEDSFDIVINAEGTDRNGTDHSTEMRLRLDVDKESHKLIITRKSLAPSAVACNRKNVQLGVGLLNIGSEDEEKVTLSIVSPDLGIDFSEDVGELESGSVDEDTSFSKTYFLNVPNDLEAGSYPITLIASYNDDRKKAEDTVSLSVNDCATKVEETKDSSEEAPVVLPPVTIIEPPAATGATTEISFLKSNTFLAIVIIIMLVAVVLGVALVAIAFRGG
ncbi:hypothetical protein HYS31_00980 [Candidatus Woesearchaeota archaeon]|nr:hypothetical protein [Candidatus Woesearchaeota archaeon]